MPAKVLSRHTGVVVAVSRRLNQLSKALRLLRHPVWRRGLMRGVAATIEHVALAELVQPASVIDIGANKGQFTLFALGAFPGCRILAFEPLPGPAAIYRNITQRFPRVTLIEAAIGPYEQVADMFVLPREDSSSLLPVSDLATKVFPEVAGAAKRQAVRVAPLRAFIDKAWLSAPCLLKIDVQGFELEVLKGCEDLLEKITHVYVECSHVELYRGQPLFNELRSWLERRGYCAQVELNRVEAPSVGPVQSDFLFTRG